MSARIRKGNFSHQQICPGPIARLFDIGPELVSEFSGVSKTCGKRSREGQCETGHSSGFARKCNRRDSLLAFDKTDSVGQTEYGMDDILRTGMTKALTGGEKANLIGSAQ